MKETEQVQRWLRHPWGRRAVQSPWSFRLAKWQFARRERYPLEALRQIAAFGLDVAANAVTSRGRRVWSTAFFPSELLHAANLNPFTPEVAAAVLASLGLGPEFLRRSEQAGFDSELCSIHRCAAGGFYEELFPPPDLLLASGHLCEGAPHLFRHWSRLYRAPLLYLDVPSRDGPEAEEYLARQLEEIAGELEGFTGGAITKGRWRQVIENSNQAREALQAVNYRRREEPSPLWRDEGLALVFLQFVGFGHPRASTILETLLRELDQSRSRPQQHAAPGAQRYRLLWLHLKPYFPNGLFDWLEEELSARVVMEEMNQVYWEPLDPDDPYRSLAQKILSHPGVGPVSKRIEAIARLARELDVDGVVHYSHWGCRQSVGALPLVKQALNREGLPFLSLEGDCVDPAGFFPGQARTRLEAFLEMLGQAAG